MIANNARYEQLILDQGAELRLIKEEVMCLGQAARAPQCKPEEWQSQLQQANTENDQLKSTIEELHRQQSGQVEQIEHLTAERDNSASEVAALSGKLQQLEAQVEQLNQDKQKLESEWQANQSQIQELKPAMEGMEATVLQLKQQLNDEQNINKELQTKLEALEQSLKAENASARNRQAGDAQKNADNAPQLEEPSSSGNKETAVQNASPQQEGQASDGIEFHLPDVGHSSTHATAAGKQEPTSTRKSEADSNRGKHFRSQPPRVPTSALSDRPRRN